MFTQIFYLTVVLLIISFSPQNQQPPLTLSPLPAFLLGSAAYIFTLILIALQNILFSKWLRNTHHILLATANALLILFLLAIHSLLIFPSILLVSAASLTLYFGGLYVFHRSAYPRIPAGSRGLASSANLYAINHLRFLLPFCLPFLLIACIMDAITLIPADKVELSRSYSALFTIGLLALLLLIVLFYPPLTIRIWKCRDLSSSKLKQNLDALCVKAQFKHAGIKTWTVLNHSYTAAIIGILPRFRYIMFTKRLLNELSPRSINAILAHEIGHCAHKHLLYYPAVIFGILVLFALGTPLLEPIASSFTFLALYSLVFFIYLRVVFGYFSRLFERQADLHVYQLGIPVEDMQLALDEIGHATGGTHQVPCWHHYSIQKRIDFLEATKKDPLLIAKHHQRVRLSLILYFILLGVGIIFTYKSFF